MNKELYLAAFCLYILFLVVITGVNAAEKEGDFIRIQEKMVDITGDGIRERIEIKGNPIKKGGSFYKKLLLQVTDGNGNRHEARIQEGFEPKTQFADLNQDGIKDMFISIKESEDTSNFYLFTFTNGKLAELAVPQPLIIQSQFLDGYKAKVTIDNIDKTYVFNLKGRKRNYEKLGFYQNGILSEPTELIISPYNMMEPVRYKGKRKVLKGIQRISGAYYGDFIAYVESVWSYDGGNWKLLKTEVYPIK